MTKSKFDSGRWGSTLTYGTGGWGGVAKSIAFHLSLGTRGIWFAHPPHDTSSLML